MKVLAIAFILLVGLAASTIHEEKVVLEGRTFIVRFAVQDDKPQAWINRPQKPEQWESEVDVFEIMNGERKQIGSGLGKWSTNKKLKDDARLWVQRNK